ncbi:hypothetical protein AALD22_13620 [Lachnospiraceae bacterium 56-18]|jgi:hypothetical protein|uniref:hypothetical protein n=1 Tax=Sporofaciens sp. JLR.KK001 TaxID=3112621 RepID=UPI002FEF43F3
MSSENIAKRIAEELLNDNVLDEQNFNYDTDAILQHVQDTVLSHLRDYSLLAGQYSKIDITVT